ncbi:MAG TPA: hypothetical protein VLV15_08425 [Dongiaceae bacterium]|nr:hypothetical protein [Dongiaceae bacterium]
MLTAPASCETDYSLALGQKPADVDGSALDCTCTCSVERKCTYQLTMFDSAGCKGGTINIVHPNADGVCTADESNAYSVLVQRDPNGCTAYPAAMPTPMNDAGHSPSTRDIVACAPPTSDRGGCMTGELCAPPSALVCVEAAGELACPTGFPVRTVSYDVVTDTRKCTGMCGKCTTTTNGDCNLATFFTGGNGPCMDAGGKPLDAGMLCADLSAAQYAGLTATPAGNGTCTVDAAALPVMGALTTTGPTTYCCVAGR